MFQEQSQKKAAWVEYIIKDFIEGSPENTLQDKNNEKAFDTPLVGFSRGDDPLYEEYKDHVGPFYMTPQEIFELTFRTVAFGTYLATGNKIKDPGSPEAKPEELAIISWILPHTRATKADNRKADFYPAERWARARIFGEQVNAKLRGHVVDTLTAAGIQAVAPSLTPQFGYHRRRVWSSSCSRFPFAAKARRGQEDHVCRLRESESGQICYRR